MNGALQIAIAARRNCRYCRLEGQPGNWQVLHAAQRVISPLRHKNSGDNLEERGTKQAAVDTEDVPKYAKKQSDGSK